MRQHSERKDYVVMPFILSMQYITPLFGFRMDTGGCSHALCACEESIQCFTRKGSEVQCELRSFLNCVSDIVRLAISAEEQQ